MTAEAVTADVIPGPDALSGVRDQGRELSRAERQALARLAEQAAPSIHAGNRRALERLLAPIETLADRRGWSQDAVSPTRNTVLAEMHARGSAYWSWGQEVWTELATSDRARNQQVRFHLVALGHVFGGHRRLHAAARISHLSKVADLVYGSDATAPAIEQVTTTLLSWDTSRHTVSVEVANATLDLLLTCGSPHLRDITENDLMNVLADHRSGKSSRRKGLFKVSRVLAAQGQISRPLSTNQHHRGPRASTLADVPPAWLDWVQRWQRLATYEPGTLRTMSSVLLVAGRWVGEKHPEAITPDLWTRDMAAEYVADTLQAKIGQWAGHNTNSSRLGQPLGVPGMANRIDSIRGFFCDLIEWEWIHPRFDPRRVLSLPASRRAQLGPNPRIIDDVAWAKLMAAGITLNTEDLPLYGTPAARATGQLATYYPIEMVRAVVGVWLFAACRIDEIRRLELDCVRWDEGVDEATGQPYPICLLHVPANKTSGAFTKPVDPLVGQVIEAWKLVRPPQPDIVDRKTGQARQHLFTYRGQLIGPSYLNEKIIPALCAKAGIPESDSRGALTSHRARATIATQLLNARDPLSLADLQAWLGHKHPSSTRHYAAILQRTLTAAYRKADYFARNQRTIQVLIDRDTILSGAAAGGGQPWKYYDLGDGFCSYDFFAKCPHRLACARCPFYLPKDSHRGQLLQVKVGIDQMLEQLDLTDAEREALEGDRQALTDLAARLADIPTPAGPTPRQLGTEPAFVPLTELAQTLERTRP